MHCKGLIRNILCLVALTWLSFGCNKSEEDDAFVLDETDQVDSKRVNLAKQPRPVEIIVEEPAPEPAVISPAIPVEPVEAPPLTPPAIIPPLLPTPIAVPIFPEEDDSECDEDSECSDDNDCTDDSCIDGECENTDNTDNCNDGNECTTNDQCNDGKCEGAAETPDETTDIQCRDGLDNDCDGKTDCEDSGCASNQCQDNNPCTVGETCSNSACSGPRVNLVVGQVTYDFCSALTPCAYILCTNALVCGTPTSLANGDGCSDGDICSFPDTCNAGLCVSGPDSCQ